MQILYSDQSYEQINRQLKRRLTILFAVAAVLLALFLYAMIARCEWLAMVSACLLECFIIFYADLFCAPLLRYRRLVRSALSGRAHEKTMVFDHLEPESSAVDGVACRSLIFLGDADKHGSREVLLYWDQEIPLESLTPGETYTVRFTGKNIIGIQPASPEDPSSRP